MKYKLIFVLAAALCLTSGTQALADLYLGVTWSTLNTDAPHPGIVFEITDSGIVTRIDSSILAYDTNFYPYGSEDSYVGVINHSSHSVSSISLTSSGNDIFHFDGDGIAGLGYVTGNVSDPKGYGGPNTYFSGINGAEDSGTANFITPLSYNDFAYFSLEGNPSVVNTTTPVPEPASIVMLGIGIAGLAGYMRRQRAKRCAAIG